MPERLRLSRKRGFRLPLNAKSVARPSKWGNPFRIRWVDCKGGGMCWQVTDGYRLTCDHLNDKTAAATQAVGLFREWISDPGNQDGLPGLRGLDLACWCPLDQPCHADVLLELANAGGLDA